VIVMTPDEVLAKLADYLEELFEVPRETVTLEAKLYEELDLDSIDAVDLVVQLQNLIGRRINPEEFKTVRTVGDVVNCVERMLVANAAVHP
jgi:acyl carrier protein